MINNKNYLARAVELAKIAGEKGNHPCGSVIVDQNGKIVAESGNEVFTTPDITAHAEMRCLRKASKELMDKKSGNVYTLYSSLEPCYGCSFYISRSVIRKVVYAGIDKYARGLGELKADPKYDKNFGKFEIVEEPFPELRDESWKLMRDYLVRTNRPDSAKFFDPI